MNVTHLDQHLPLRNHLLKFGIRDQVPGAGADVFEDAPEPRQLKRLEQLGRALGKAHPKKVDILAFYELIATPRMASLVHSNKADAIRATGDFVLRELEGERILDVGCNIGYLTSWYAVRNPDMAVQGIDLSPSSIAAASRHAARLGIGNLRYAIADGHRFSPEQTFDCVVDTQGMLDHETDPATVERLFSWLKADGKLICIPALGTLEKFSAFLDALAPGLCTITSLTWLEFSAGGEPGAYPAMIVRPGRRANGLARDELIEAYQLGWLACRNKTRRERLYG